MSDEMPSESYPTYEPAASAPPGTTCPACGGETFEEGFLEDTGESGKGRVRWIVGPLELGPLGGTKRFGRTRLELTGRRCGSCGRVDLFANGQA